MGATMQYIFALAFVAFWQHFCTLLTLVFPSYFFVYLLGFPCWLTKIFFFAVFFMHCMIDSYQALMGGLEGPTRGVWGVAVPKCIQSKVVRKPPPNKNIKNKQGS